jgi:hypothetical protein
MRAHAALSFENMVRVQALGRPEITMLAATTNVHGGKADIMQGCSNAIAANQNGFQVACGVNLR